MLKMDDNKNLIEKMGKDMKENSHKKYKMPVKHEKIFNFTHKINAAAASLQSCPTLCNPIDRSPPGSTVPGILQARTLEWVAISFSNA